MSIVFFAQYADKAGTGSWVTLSAAGACGFIALLSLWRGEKKITRLDWVSFGAAIISMPLWYFTKDPLLSVLLLSSINLFAIVPTIRKSWHTPYGETLVFYVLTVVRFALAIVATENFSFTTVLYPASCVVAQGVFITIVLYRRRLLCQPQNENTH